MNSPRVIIESPLSGDFERNKRYARLCLLDSLQRGEAPFASHLLYPQVYDDTDPSTKEAGISAGLAWQSVADLVAAYTDYGVSPGMQRALGLARETNTPIEMRQLGDRLLVPAPTPGFHDG